MCVIIYKPKGKEISEKTIKKAIEINRDGCGWYLDGKIEKELDCKKAYEKIKAYIDEGIKEKEFVFHSRIATHGSINKKNCHPFTYKNWILFHNGVMGYQSERDETDSEYFLREIWNKNVKGNYISIDFLESLEKILTSNRLCLINKQSGKIYTFGHWHEVNGIKYSNNMGGYIYPKFTYDFSRYWESYRSLKQEDLNEII